MRRFHRFHREFWVGTLKRRGSHDLGLVVFDPLLQPDFRDRNYVDLFEVAEGKVGEFRKDVVRGLIGHPELFDDSAIQKAIDLYCRVTGINPEAEWVEAQAAKKDHQSVCWDCWAKGETVVVDRRLHSVCQSCGWIQCPECGACRDPRYGGCSGRIHRRH